MKNYQYWQQEGAYWKEEYERRRRSSFYFIVQEAAIAYFFSLNCPAKVLEYGCGVGRHLKYLRNIPNLEVYGCDQSPTMLEAITQWGGNEWFEQYIELVEPTGTLPYEDGAFDIAFTSEVLIHTRPEDVPGRLRELLRVSKKGIFHIEPDVKVDLCRGAHQGCWNHDYIEIYRELGIDCIVLPKFIEKQAFFLVDRVGCVDTGFLEHKVLADKFSLLDSLLEGFVTKIHLLQTDLDSKESRFNSLQLDLDHTKERLSLLQADLECKYKASEERFNALAGRSVEQDSWLSEVHKRTESMQLDRQLKRILQRLLSIHQKKG
jgi:SAM-dependent methyltransferase